MGVGCASCDSVWALVGPANNGVGVALTGVPPQLLRAKSSVAAISVPGQIVLFISVSYHHLARSNGMPPERLKMAVPHAIYGVAVGKVGMMVGGVDVGRGVLVGNGVLVGDLVDVAVGVLLAVKVGPEVSVGIGVRDGVAVGGSTGVAVKSASPG